MANRSGISPRNHCIFQRADKLQWRELVGTSRCGIFSQTPDPSWVDGANNWQAANLSLATADWSPSPDAGPLGEAVYKLLTPGYSSSWETFETTLYTNPDPANFMSVEYIHNYIHVSCFTVSASSSYLINSCQGLDWRHRPSNRHWPYDRSRCFRL